MGDFSLPSVISILSETLVYILLFFILWEILVYILLFLFYFTTVRNKCDYRLIEDGRMREGGRGDEGKVEFRGLFSNE